MVGGTCFARLTAGEVHSRPALVSLMIMAPADPEGEQPGALRLSWIRSQRSGSGCSAIPDRSARKR
jgi:hypothetical protein